MAPEIPLVLEAPRRGALRPYEELLHRGFDLGCRAGRDAYPVTIVSVERRDDWPATVRVARNIDSPKPFASQQLLILNIDAQLSNY